VTGRQLMRSFILFLVSVVFVGYDAAPYRRRYIKKCPAAPGGITPDILRLYSNRAIRSSHRTGTCRMVGEELGRPV